MKQKYKLITLGAIPGFIHLFVGGKCIDAYKNLQKKTKCKIGFDPTLHMDGTGKSSHIGQSNHYFIWAYKQDPSTLAHEAVHIGMRLRQYLGPIFSDDIDEPLAYIVQHIVREGLRK